MQTKRIAKPATTLLLLALAGAPTAWAGISDWINLAGGSWNDPANWSASVPNGSADVAVFGVGLPVTPSTITLGGASFTLNGISSDQLGTLDINNGTLVFEQASPGVDAFVTTNSGNAFLSLNSAQVLNDTFRLDASAGTTIRLLGATSGTGNMMIVGDGTIDLAGDMSSWTGAVTLQSGTLRVSNSNALGSAGISTILGGTLELNANTSESWITFGGTIDLINNTTHQGDYTLFGSSVLQSSGGTITGLIGFAAGNTSVIQVDTGKTLTLMGGTTGPGDFQIDAAGTVRLTSQPLVHGGDFVLHNGTARFQTTAAFGGDAIINGGTLDIWSAGSLSGIGGLIIVESGGTLRVNEAAGGDPQNNSVAAQSVVFNGGTLRMAGDFDLSDFFHAGSTGGTFLLNTATHYTAGGTNVLDLNAIPSGASILLGARSAGSYATTLQITPHASDHTLHFGGGSALLNVRGLLADVGPDSTHIDITGPSLTQFSAANTYTGETVIHSGTLLVSHADALGTGSVTRILGGQLHITGNVNEAIEIDGGSLRLLNNGTYTMPLNLLNGTVIGGTLTENLHTTLAGPIIVSAGGTALLDGTFDLDASVSGSGGLNWLLGDSFSSRISTINAPLTFAGNLIVDSDTDFYRLEFREASTYAGVTELSTANFAVHDALGLGSDVAGTTIFSGQLEIFADTNEALTLHPDARIDLRAGGNIASLTSHGGLFTHFDAFLGPVTLVQGRTLWSAVNGQLDSVVSGAGDLDLDGITVLSGNTYSGITYITGEVFTQHAQALGSTAGQTIVESGTLFIDVASQESIRVENGTVNFRAIDGPNTNTVILAGGAVFATTEFAGSIFLESPSTLRSGRFSGPISGSGNLSLNHFSSDPDTVIVGSNPFTGIVLSFDNTVFDRSDVFNHAKMIVQANERLTLIDGSDRTILIGDATLRIENDTTLNGLWVVNGRLGGPGAVSADRLILEGASENSQPGGTLTINDFLVIQGQQLFRSSIQGPGDIYLINNEEFNDFPSIFSDFSGHTGDIHLIDGVWGGRNDNAFGGALTTIRFSQGSTAQLLAVDDAVISTNIDTTATRYAQIQGDTTGNLNLGNAFELAANGLNVGGTLTAHDLFIIQSSSTNDLELISFTGTDFSSLTGTLTFTPHSRFAPSSFDPLTQFTIAQQASVQNLDAVVLEGGAQLWLNNDFLNNAGPSIALQDRLGDATEIISDGGFLWFEGSRTQAVSETVGTIVLRNGRTHLYADGQGQATTLTLTAFQRIGHSTVGIVEDTSHHAPVRLLNPGVAPGELIGAWATRYDGFATVDAQGFITAVATTSNDLNTALAIDHVLVASSVVLGTSKSIDAIVVDNGNAQIGIDLDTHTLTVQSGGIFLASPLQLHNGTLTSATQELIFSAPADRSSGRGNLVLSADIEDNSAPLALILNSLNADLDGTFTHTGGTFLYNSNVEITNLGAIPTEGDLHLYDTEYRFNNSLSAGTVTYGTITVDGDSIFTPAPNIQIVFDELRLRDGEISIPNFMGDGTIIHDGAGSTKILGNPDGFTGDVIVENGYLSARRFNDNVSITVTGGLFEASFQNSTQGVTLTLAGGAIVGEDHAYLRDINVTADSTLMDIVIASNITGNGQLTVGRHLGHGFFVNDGVGADIFNADASGFTGDWLIEAGTLTARAQASGLGAGDITIGLGATLDLQGNSNTSPPANNITFDGGGTIFAQDQAILTGNIDASGIVWLGVRSQTNNVLEFTGQVRLQDELSIVGEGTSSDPTNWGLVKLSGDVLVGSDVRWNPGFTRVEITGTVRPDTTDASLRFAGLIEIPASTATFDLVAGKTLTLLDDIGQGSLTLNGGGAVVGDGTLRADVIADNTAFIAPGHSAGLLTIDGAVTMRSGSTLRIEFEDASQPAGVGFDQLVVSGVFNAGGELDVTTLVGFTLTQGDTFDVVTADSVIGRFASFNSTTLDGDLGFSVNYLPTLIQLEVGLLGDLTGDGFVGAEDLDVIFAKWGNFVDAGNWLAGDVDGSGRVGQGDLAIVLDHWSNGLPPEPNVPEPTTAFGLLSMLYLLKRRHRVGEDPQCIRSQAK